MRRRKDWPTPDLEDWFLLTPLSHTRAAIFCPEWQDRPQMGPWLLPDGRDIVNTIEAGDADELPFPVVFEMVSGGLSQGLDDVVRSAFAICLASPRLLDVLDACDVDGLVVRDVTLVDKRGRPVPERHRHLVPPVGSGEVRSGHPDGPNGTLAVSPRVLRHLTAAGVDRFELYSLAEWWATSDQYGPDARRAPRLDPATLSPRRGR